MLLELVVFLAAWAMALFVLSRRQGSVAEAAILVSVACFVALTAGYGLESVAMRKSATLSVGCFVLAAWAAWVPIAEPRPWMAAVGLLGLAIVGATPPDLRARDSKRERGFLARHKRWSAARATVRRWLVTGMIVGLAISAATGLWRSFSST